MGQSFNTEFESLFGSILSVISLYFPVSVVVSKSLPPRTACFLLEFSHLNGIDRSLPPGSEP